MTIGATLNDITNRVFNIRFENNTYWYEGWKTLGTCQLKKGETEYIIEENINENGHANGIVIPQTERDKMQSTEQEALKEPDYYWSFETEQEQKCGGYLEGAQISPSKKETGVKITKNDYVEIPEDCEILKNEGSYSINMWFKLNEIPNSYGGSLLNKYSGRGDDGIVIMVMNNEEPYIFARMHEGTKNITVAASIEKGKWNYLSVVNDAEEKEFKMYLNGELVSRSVWSGNYKSAPTPIYLGRNNWNTWEIDAEIDELKIYNEALRAEDVLLEYGN